MSQLLKESTAIPLDSENRPTSPAETQLLDWERYLQPTTILSGSHFPQSPEYVASVTAASDRDTSDRILSNGTEDWNSLQILFPNDRVSPSSRAFNLNSLADMWRTNWVLGEWAGALIFPERKPIIFVGSVSTALDQGELFSEGSTQTGDAALLLEEQLVNYFDKLVNESVDEVFSDGMDTAFSQRLNMAVEACGHAAVHAIDRLLRSDRADVEVVGEFLRQMGSVEDPWTHHSRLDILINNIQSPDPRIRDAASLGLAALDDPAAIGAICSALERESSPQLRRNLKLVKDQLQSTLWHVS